MFSHKTLEKNIGWLMVASFIVVSIGGLVQIVPLFFQKSTTQPVPDLKPYNALQLAGRDIYIREGCYTCHSQMVRPFRAETERYGHFSVAGEFVYDRPFLWGSKRTGPDLHRVGGRYSDQWHYVHLMQPRDVVPESNMPAYPWLAERMVAETTGKDIVKKMTVLKNWAGHPYTDQEIAEAPAMLEGKTEMEALIAYLQVLGTAGPKLQ